jgi:hypothetical protein
MWKENGMDGFVIHFPFHTYIDLTISTEFYARTTRLRKSPLPMLPARNFSKVKSPDTLIIPLEENCAGQESVLQREYFASGATLLAWLTLGIFTQCASASSC